MEFILEKERILLTMGQFHQQFMSSFFVRMLNVTYNLRTKKLQITLLYEKAAHIMLVKLTPGVNFTNILRAAFAPKFIRQKIKTETVST